MPQRQNWRKDISRLLIIVFYVSVLIYSFAFGKWFLLFLTALALLLWIAIDLQSSREHLPKDEREQLNRKDFNLAASCLVWVVAIFMGFFIAIFMFRDTSAGMLGVLLVFALGLVLLPILAGIRQGTWINNAKNTRERSGRIAISLIFSVQALVFIVGILLQILELFQDLP